MRCHILLIFVKYFDYYPSPVAIRQFLIWQQLDEHLLTKEHRLRVDENNN
jgi:hypothetical protein